MVNLAEGRNHKPVAVSGSPITHHHTTAGRSRYNGGMDRPAPDPNKLLASWMEWERGDTTPGEVMKNLKHGGLRDILEELAAATGAPSQS